MSLVELDFNQSTNLFVVPEDTGPQIPRASINRDAFYGEEMASVPVPSIRLEHPDHGPTSSLVEQLVNAIRLEIEVRCDVEVVVPGTLRKTEFKAKRVTDKRKKG